MGTLGQRRVWSFQNQNELAMQCAISSNSRDRKSERLPGQQLLGKRLTSILISLSAGTILANGAISLTFDPANSNVGDGLYAFDLAGVPVSPTPTFNSQFDLRNFSPILNTLNPIQALSAPTGWSLNGPNDVNSVRWYFEALNGAVNGVFKIEATADLHGTINWDYQDPGNGTSLSSIVTIPVLVIPEPAFLGLTSGAALLSLIVGSSWSRFMTGRVIDPLKDLREPKLE